MSAPRIPSTVSPSLSWARIAVASLSVLYLNLLTNNSRFRTLNDNDETFCFKSSVRVAPSTTSYMQDNALVWQAEHDGRSPLHWM